MSKVTDFDRAHIEDILTNPREYNWLACHIIRLVAKAHDEDRELLHSIWPDHVEAFEQWQAHPHNRDRIKPAPRERPGGTASINYSPRQREYIDSVDGQAHHSAVQIIGQLEAELADKRPAAPRVRGAIQELFAWMARDAGGERVLKLPSGELLVGNDLAAAERLAAVASRLASDGGGTAHLARFTRVTC